MDMETIKRINREALRAAQEAEAASKGCMGSNQMVVYLIAAGVAAATYLLLKQYQPKFVQVTENGVSKYDEKRAVIAAVIAGLLVLLLNQVLYK